MNDKELIAELLRDRQNLDAMIQVRIARSQKEALQDFIQQISESEGVALSMSDVVRVAMAAFLKGVGSSAG